jgi:ribonuclease-3
VVITAALYHNHPTLPEGQLAKLRASVVNSRALAGVARNLGPGGIGPYLRLGKGEEATGGRDKSSILADTLEALLGAIYLQHGLERTSEVIHKIFDPLMSDAAGRGAALDWKTSLQELTAELALGVPEYRIEDAGPDHAKTFTAWVLVAGERFGGAEGRSKKEAEQRAAASAWQELKARAVAASAADSAPDDAVEALKAAAGAAAGGSAPVEAAQIAATPAAAPGSDGDAPATDEDDPPGSGP